MVVDLAPYIVRPVLMVGVILIIVWLIICQPSFRTNNDSAIHVKTDHLENHVRYLSVDLYPRNYLFLENLNIAADYIYNHFRKAGAEVSFQEFKVKGRTYKNVRAYFGKGKGHKMIVGAHYDSWADTPGADDNASGVAGLLELAYLVGSREGRREVELVAYCLEEPPYFSTPEMGSAYHAAAVEEEGKDIDGVIVLEMIGYFNEEKKSQNYPLNVLKMLYPSTADFIIVAGIIKQRSFIKAVKVAMKGTSDLGVYSISSPRSLTGIDFSDHRNYWPYDINSVMITDTSFYRNNNYHKKSDTFDTLDYVKMSKVVVGVFEVLEKLEK
jgi:Zn-dependent M28 family amino/carboxypeptidase